MKDTLLTRTIKENPQRLPTMLEYKLVDVNEPNHDGWVPIMTAFVYSPESVPLLLAAGASIQPVKDALDYAKQKGTLEAAHIIQSVLNTLEAQGVSL